jgi:hypothetical protein
VDIRTQPPSIRVTKERLPDTPGLPPDAPLVQGFAITLAAGVLVSMFSAIVVTRTFMHALVGTGIARRHDWFLPELTPDTTARGESQA